MREPLKNWRDVSLAEFEAFLRNYPRTLEARPPVTRKVNFRQWIDPTFSAWPGNAMAKCATKGDFIKLKCPSASSSFMM